MRYFVALPKTQMGFYIVGQLVDSLTVSKEIITANQVVRMVEMADQTGRVRYSLVPDPFFTTDRQCEINRSDLLMYRETDESENDGVVKEYQNMLMQLRFKKSGLVSSHTQGVDVSNKKILQEGGL